MFGVFHTSTRQQLSPFVRKKKELGSRRTINARCPPQLHLPLSTAALLFFVFAFAAALAGAGDAARFRVIPVLFSTARLPRLCIHHILIRKHESVVAESNRMRHAIIAPGTLFPHGLGHRHGLEAVK
ncbi:hypothetical protein K438DRAFT_1973478 [Mycena galopus ATCC 62051]|nr:hypothetical protein K438DRAFT_1973478 [Mycena galopus ATCC 62051]